MIKIAVKELATFLYSSGDLSYEFFYNSDKNDGTKAHQYLQKKYDKNSKAEVYIKRYEVINDNEIEITGFIDGMHEKNVLEEIKSTKIDLLDITDDYHKEHLAQLKIYMAMYLLENNLESIEGRLTYINIDTYDYKSINYKFDKEEILLFYYESLNEYLEWISNLEDDYKIKQESLKKLRFPYESYRLGQKDFMKATFACLRDHKILYGLAPTGIGKTISVLYPAFKNLKNPNDKIFYLTSKNTLKKLAIDTTTLMVKNGTHIRLVELTSKEKMCYLKQEFCQPDNCIYAKGFFEKLKPAIKDVLKENILSKEIIDSYAQKHELCPFEFSLYLSEYSDIVVGDYNYVFDPQVRLIRYFEEDKKYNVYTLIDEAHNLVDRARSMYSEELTKDTLIAMKKSFKGLKPSINKNINNITNYIDSLLSEEDKNIISNGLDELIMENIEEIVIKCQKIFEETPKDKIKNYNNCMKGYLAVKGFKKISEYFSSSHRFIIENKEDYNIKIECLDASKFTHETINKLDGTILFSATLTPLNYFKELITENEGEQIILPSPFKQENMNLIFNDSIDTYYQNRANSVKEIVDMINVMVSVKNGNYIVFFPSYQYLNIVLEKVKESYPIYEIIEQEKDMSINQRDKIISLFDDNITSKVGFFVMGGVFSEGIDFVGDKLSGVLIVSVALPQINYTNELLKEHFDERFNDGFNYSYTYPGFNKLLQSAGRVIRSNEDKGVIIIADKRITNYKYLSMIPSHWNHYKRINNIKILEKELKNFWNKK